MKLILNEDEPIFIQISKAIEDEILTDSIKEDEQVPSTTELSRLYNINPATVLKGMNILIEEANKLDIDKDELLEMIKQYKGGN